ncbi:MAG: glutathione S-transferase [Pseudomonadota bacterium]
MSALILHHHDPSPFAEKIRLLFGLKGLSWQSVQVSMVMPRPHMTALTGGYRRIPVLQIGADVYCDTALICREIERRHPEPATGASGIGIALGQWSDRAFFDAGASLAMGTDEVPGEVIEDRKAFFTHLDFDAFRGDRTHLLGQLGAHAQLIEDALADGRSFVAGDRPGWMDILAWFPVWMAHGYVAEAGSVLAGLERLAAWSARMAELEHGSRVDIEAEEALAIARESTPDAGRGVSDALADLAEGARVAVTPADYGKDPVIGSLVTLDRHEIAIRRSDPACGEVVIHFPRIGFRVDVA